MKREKRIRHGGCALRFWVTLCCVLFICPVPAGRAGAVLKDKDGIYTAGMALVQANMYREASEQFDQIKDYADSKSWSYYCRGMVEIQEADALEVKGMLSDAEKHISSASQYFGLLAGAQFENSAVLKVYCTARSYELKRLNQKAIDTYAGLFGILDSDERYLRLSQNILLPTQAPKAEKPPLLSPIPAHALRWIDTYLGPGSDYVMQNTVRLDSQTEISLLAEENGFYMLETQTEGGMIRFWAPKERIHKDGGGSVPVITQNLAAPRKLVIQKAACSLGPGEDYMAFGEEVKPGVYVTVIGTEGDFTQIELPLEKTPVRVWVPTQCLSR